MFDSIYYVYLILLGLASIFYFVRGDKSFSIGGLYSAFSIPLIIFTIFRPFGLMRDDPGYLQRFENFRIEGAWLGTIIDRDPLWHLVVGLFLIVWDDPRVMLIISGAVLLAKLYLLYKISERNKLLVLFMYACIYWQLHDLTQLRASMAVMFFLLFVYLLEFNRRFVNEMALLGAFASHAQAFPAVLLLGSRPLIAPRYFFIYLVVIFVLLLAGAYPDLSAVSTFLYGRADGSYLFEAYDMYHQRAEQGDYDAFRNVPLIFLACQIVFGLIALEVKSNYTAGRVQLAYKSIIIGVTLAFLFASVSDVQVRFYEFFFVGGLIFVGLITSKWSFALCMLLAFFYFLKFNILWSIWDLNLGYL